MSSEAKSYVLQYSGQEVDNAITKINALDPSTASTGITELESTEANGYNLNFLRTVGLYKAAFIHPACAPSGMGVTTPVYIYVSQIKDTTLNGIMTQRLLCGDTSFSRTSIDLGINWSTWTSNDGLNTADEITDAEVDALFAAISRSVQADLLLKNIQPPAGEIAF